MGEKLHAEQEPDNAVDKFAMKVVKDNETVGHFPCEYLRIYTWRKDMRGGDWLQRSMQAAVRRNELGF